MLRLQEGGASAGYAREDDDDDDEPEFELKVEDDDEDEDDEEEDQPPAKKSKKGAGHGGGGLGADEEENIPCIYTDGSSLANGRAGAVAGVGVYFGAGDPRLVSTFRFFRLIYSSSIFIPPPSLPYFKSHNPIYPRRNNSSLPRNPN